MMKGGIYKNLGLQSTIFWDTLLHSEDLSSLGMEPPNFVEHGDLKEINVEGPSHYKKKRIEVKT